MKTQVVQRRQYVHEALQKALVAGALYMGLNIGILLGITRDSDRVLLVGLQQYIPVDWDRFLSVLSVLGSFEITVVLLFLLTFRKKKLFFWSVFVFVVVHGIEVFGKLFFFHPSVPLVYHRYDFPFTMASSGFQTGNSFPSGHSLRSVLLILLGFWLIPVKQKTIQIAGLVFLSIILFSRVSLGEHWPSDVIGGSLLGISGFFFIRYKVL